MESGQTLIDQAVHVVATRYQLAKILGESEANLGSMARGKRGIPPRLAARLAAIAGLDPREAACAAVLAQEQDPERRAELAEIFGLPVDGPEWLHTKP